MRFRRIYWVTEQLSPDGRSSVVGVFTSIHDLVATGLPAIPNKGAGYRVSLFELDSDATAVACFSSPDFSGVAATMEPLVKGGEFTHEEANSLAEALGG